MWPIRKSANVTQIGYCYRYECLRNWYDTRLLLRCCYVYVLLYFCFSNTKVFIFEINFKNYLTLFRVGILGTAHGWEVGPKSRPYPAPLLLPKISHTYPTMMKPGSYTLKLYLTQRRSKKCISHVTHPLSSADISIFSLKTLTFYFLTRRLTYGKVSHFSKKKQW